jgi:hypothetical protein
MCETKVCKQCGEEKPLSQFNSEKRCKDGKKGKCKSCEKDDRERKKGITINRRVLKLKKEREKLRLKPFKEIDKNLKRRARIKSKAEDLKEEFLNKEFGSYKVIEYMGYYNPNGDNYPRHHFKKVCRFCGTSSICQVSKLRLDINRETPLKCNLCSESVNIHTQEKRCNCCGEWKHKSEFPKCKNRFWGIYYYCKICHHEKSVERRKDPEVRKREYLRSVELHKDNHLYKFKCRIRCNIKNSFILGGWRKTTKTFDTLGCSYEEFVEHISSKFLEGMTIENHGEWHLDHIIPIALAETEEEAIELCHYTNYQPLWGSDNISKSDNIVSDMITEDNKVRYKKFLDRI